MRKHVCKYSIIRFQPYAETGEFANIGIVLYALQHQKIEFKILDSRQHGRISNFFKPLDKNIFRHTTQILQTELKRIQAMQKHTPHVDFFAELTRSREDIIRYSNTRVLYSEDLMVTVNQLFDFYVQRRFTQEKGHEVYMKRQVQQVLQTHHLADTFKDKIVGDKNKFSIRFPFVHDNNQYMVIKPIHFKHHDSSQLIKHGLSWLSNVNQLSRDHFLKPEMTLFAYAPPDYSTGKLRDAFNDVRGQIEDAGIHMVNINHQQKIAEFAQSAKE